MSDIGELAAEFPWREWLREQLARRGAEWRLEMSEAELWQAWGLWAAVGRVLLNDATATVTCPRCAWTGEPRQHAEALHCATCRAVLLEGRPR